MKILEPKELWIFLVWFYQTTKTFLGSTFLSFFVKLLRARHNISFPGLVVVEAGDVTLEWG